MYRIKIVEFQNIRFFSMNISEWISQKKYYIICEYFDICSSSFPFLYKVSSINHYHKVFHIYIQIYILKAFCWFSIYFKFLYLQDNSRNANVKYYRENWWITTMPAVAFNFVSQIYVQHVRESFLSDLFKYGIGRADRANRQCSRPHRVVWFSKNGVFRNKYKAS